MAGAPRSIRGGSNNRVHAQAARLCDRGFRQMGQRWSRDTRNTEKHGFDLFFGYYDQVQRPSYYPPYLIRNSEEVSLAGNNGGTKGETYSHYLIHDAAMQFIRPGRCGISPFSPTYPTLRRTGNFNIPDNDPGPGRCTRTSPRPTTRAATPQWSAWWTARSGDSCPHQRARNTRRTRSSFSAATMAVRLLRQCGESARCPLGKQRPEDRRRVSRKKGQLYEGGLRIPFIARWPGKIAPGSVSDSLRLFS